MQQINQARRQIVKEVALCGLGFSILFNSLRAFSYANKSVSASGLMTSPIESALLFVAPASMLMCLGFAIQNRLFSHVFNDDIGANKIFFYSAATIYGVTSLVNSIYNANSPISTNILFPMFVATLLVTGKEVIAKLLNDNQQQNINPQPLPQ